ILLLLTNASFAEHERTATAMPRRRSSGTESSRGQWESCGCSSLSIPCRELRNAADTRSRRFSQCVIQQDCQPKSAKCQLLIHKLDIGLIVTFIDSGGLGFHDASGLSV